MKVEKTETGIHIECSQMEINKLYWFFRVKSVEDMYKLFGKEEELYNQHHTTVRDFFCSFFRVIFEYKNSWSKE